MIDPAYLKQEDLLEKVLTNLQKRGHNPEDVNKIKDIVTSRSRLIGEVETLQGQRNSRSKEIGQLMAKGADATEVEAIKAEVKKIGDDLKALKEKQEASQADYDDLLLSLPNILNEKVPQGSDENDNQLIRTHGDPDSLKKTLPHHEALEKENDIDFARGVKLAGSRFYVYNERLARLERKLAGFMLDTHGEAGYRERFVPFVVRDECMRGTGQYPKFQDEYYRLERDEMSLIPTAEVPLTNLYADEILSEEDLPIYLTAHTPCFRREAGAAGKDTKGLIRVHQFQKVELVKFVHPDKSAEELETLTANAEAILQKLNLTYRVMLLCSGDTSAASSQTYDIEVYMPGLGRWLEISSCSNFLDYQARRAKIRYKDPETRKNRFVHTLNGSGVACGRLVAALIEYHQKEDGTIDWQAIDKLLD